MKGCNTRRHMWEAFGGNESLITQQASRFASASHWEGCSSPWRGNNDCAVFTVIRISQRPNQQRLSGNDKEQWLRKSALHPAAKKTCNLPREGEQRNLSLFWVLTASLKFLYAYKTFFQTLYTALYQGRWPDNILSPSKLLFNLSPEMFF